jgi:hypothetical protein
VNVLTSNDPSQSLKSKILTDPGSVCVDVSEDCQTPWFATDPYYNVEMWKCMANFGPGLGNTDLCLENGGSKISIESKDNGNAADFHYMLQFGKIISLN